MNPGTLSKPGRFVYWTGYQSAYYLMTQVQRWRDARDAISADWVHFCRSAARSAASELACHRRRALATEVEEQFLVGVRDGIESWRGEMKRKAA